MIRAGQVWVRKDNKIVWLRVVGVHVSWVWVVWNDDPTEPVSKTAQWLVEKYDLYNAAVTQG